LDGLVGERPLGKLLAADEDLRRVDAVQRGGDRVLQLLPPRVGQARGELDPDQ
jgi:hypothetical protein